MWGAIFTGFLAVFHPPEWLTFITILVSCACVVSVVYLAITAQDQLKSIVKEPLWATHKDNEEKVKISTKSQLLATQKKKMESVLKKKNLAIICLIGMPLFPTIYFLSVFQIISDDIAYTLTMIVGMIVKLFVANVIAEGHIIASEDIDYVIAMHNLEVEAEAIKKAMDFAQNKFYKINISNSLNNSNINSGNLREEVFNGKNLNRNNYH